MYFYCTFFFLVKIFREELGGNEKNTLSTNMSSNVLVIQMDLTMQGPFQSGPLHGIFMNCHKVTLKESCSIQNFTDITLSKNEHTNK